MGIQSINTRCDIQSFHVFGDILKSLHVWSCHVIFSNNRSTNRGPLTRLFRLHKNTLLFVNNLCSWHLISNNLCHFWWCGGKKKCTRVIFLSLLRFLLFLLVLPLFGQRPVEDLAEHAVAFSYQEHALELVVQHGGLVHDVLTGLESANLETGWKTYIKTKV